MPTTPSTNSAISARYSIPLYLALITAGLAGNYFKYPIFLNIDFIFGSIFAMLALQFFGLGRGIQAAAIIAGYTYILWNHPYAIIIMTAEVAVVGWLMWRRKMGMVLADTLYWLIIGMPLVYLFYHLVMHVPLSNTYITMTKQAVNGIANALVARLIFTGYLLWSRSSLTSYSEIVYNLLAFFVLCPALIMLAVGSRTDFNETDRHIRTTLIQDSRRVTDRVETWVVNRKSAILNLAEMAASRSPHQMQPYLELAKRSDVNFQRVGLLDREATITAFYPMIDELGQNNIGKNFADRPFIPQLKRTLKPMLSEVYMARIGTARPVVSVLVPVVIAGEYGGYVIGVLGLEQIREHLGKSTDENAMFYTLLDKNGNVIMSNRTDQKVFTPFVRAKGTLNRPDNGISQWVPAMPPNTSISERWRKSFYVAETAIGDLAEWKLILEQPVAPFQKMLYDQYTDELTLLFLVLLGALVLAELLSRKIVVTLGQLSTLTYQLPVRLATDGKEIGWPESGINEANQLICNFKEMADSLSEQFIETRQINESLEQRVEERTAEVVQLANEQRIILSTMPIGACFLKERKVQLANPAFDLLFGYEIGTTKGMNTSDIYPDNETYERVGMEGYAAIAGGGIYSTDVEMKKKDGSLIWCSMVGQAVNAGHPEVGTIWMAQDITERKRTETELSRYREHLEELVAERTRELVLANEKLKELERLKSMFIASMSHEVRTPLNSVIGFSSVLLNEWIGPQNDEQKKSLSSILRSGKHLLSLINDVIDVSKIEAGMIEVSCDEFDLPELLAEVEQTVATEAQDRRLSLAVQELHLPMSTDRRRLLQCLLNLVSNAIKFTEQGGVAVEARYDEERGEVTIAVTDTGIGIEAANQDKLFQAFSRLHSPLSTKVMGTGLGLYLTKKIIVETLHGAISVTSKPGSGSTFSISIPSRLEGKEKEGQVLVSTEVKP